MNSFFSCALTILCFPFLSLFSETELHISYPSEVKTKVMHFLDKSDDLNPKDICDGLRDYLKSSGYTFVQVTLSETAGVTTIDIKPGFIGKATIRGNKHLSTTGIIKNLDWETGRIFNYNHFFNQTAKLNKYRFINVDSKLKPVRAHDGEIQVNADFQVKDEFPLISYMTFSNDGTTQSSGWRTKAGIEVWEALTENDRLNMSYTFDPKDTAQLSSYFASYQFGPNNFRQSLYIGYSDSSYDNVIASVGMNIIGDGMFAGYSAIMPFSSADPESLSLGFGVSYFKLGSQIEFSGASFSKQDFSLVLPRISLQGRFDNPFGLEGKSYWSLGVVSDLSTSDPAELSQQNPEIEKGFWVPQATIALIEPVDLLGVSGGMKLKVDGQVVNEPLPTSLKKSLGGVKSVRGYQEREAYGDSGVSLNFEYSLNSEKANLFGLEGNLQQVLFYDAGYVSNHGSITSTNKSIEMQSFGVGLLGNFEENADFSLQVGVPLNDSLDTKMHEARTHFSFNIRF